MHASGDSSRERPRLGLVSGRLRSQWCRARKLVAVLREPVYRQGLRHGTAAAVEHDAIVFRRDYRTVIDVGANRGQFALVAARRFPRAALYCVEPLPGPRRTLSQALGHHPHFRVIDQAAAAHVGPGEMLVARSDDSSSLLAATSAQLRAFPGTDQIARAHIQIGRLDDWFAPGDLTRPMLLKIDVQGAEFGVLEGARHLLEEVDTVLVECSFAELYRGQALADDVVGLVAGHGFKLAGAYSPEHDRAGRLIQADLLFERMGEASPER